jgi:hypothetical protein
VERLSIHVAASQEALRFKWIESEKAGVDLGDFAIRRWFREHWWGFLRARWIEHLQGKRFWIELDRGDFGLLQREFLDRPVLLDRVLDRFKVGQDNLDVLVWAAEWGIPTEPVIEILMALDVNSRRLVNQICGPDEARPPVTIDPTWLNWNGGTVMRLAWAIALEDYLEALPILGDALEEAGCADATILEHCRVTDQNARWSWVVDAILEVAWSLRKKEHATR